MGVVVTSELVDTPGAFATASRTLVSVWFANPNDGFGVATSETAVSNSSAVTCTDFVGTTSDGGHHFSHFKRVVTWNCASQSYGSELVFDGSGDGFLYGPALYETHDDGATWAREATTGGVLSVKTLGKSVWMVEAECSAKEIARDLDCPAALATSTNGGRSWSGAKSAPPAMRERAGVLNESALADTYLLRFSRSDALLSSVPDEVPTSMDRLPIWITSDGGGSWTERHIDCGIAAWSALITVTPSGEWIAMCAGQPSAGFQPKSTVSSVNEGRTWTRLNRCTPAGTCMGAPTPGYLGALAGVSDSVILESGLRSSINVTRNGGKSWESVNSEIDSAGDGATVIQLFGSGHCLALGSSFNLIAVTSDGGLRWTTFKSKVG
jgi:photosystem II stability/assembly factor-like uncharacterized protein